MFSWKGPDVREEIRKVQRIGASGMEEEEKRKIKKKKRKKKKRKKEKIKKEKRKKKKGKKRKDLAKRASLCDRVSGHEAMNRP